MNINDKLSKLYKELDFFEDCGYWVQHRSVYREIKKLEELQQSN